MTMTMTMAEKKMPAGPWGQELVEHLKAAGGGGSEDPSLVPAMADPSLRFSFMPACIASDDPDR